MFLATMALVVAGVTLPLLFQSYLPLVDLPHHVARLNIAAEFGDAGSTYYVATSELVPNSAVDIAWRWLGYPGDVLTFTWYVTLFCVLGLVAATMILAKVAHGRFTWWSAWAGFLAYNSAMIWGFQNFVFSAPFMLALLALWLHLETRSILVRAALFAPLVLALYVMHFFAFAAFSLAVFGREVQLILAAGRDWQSRFVSSAILAAAFLPPLVLLALANYDTSGGYVIDGPDMAFIDFGGPAERVRAVFSAVGGAHVDNRLDLFKTSGRLFLLLLAIACLASLVRSRGPRLILSSRLLGPLAALGLASVLAPSALNGVVLVDIRLPFLALAVLLAATDWRGLSAVQNALLCLVLGGLLLARGYDLRSYSQDYGDHVEQLARATSGLPSGARLLSVRAGAEGNLEADALGRLSVAYVVVWHDAFVPFLYQGAHAFEVKQQWLPITQRFGIDPTVGNLRDADMGVEVEGFQFLRNWRQDFTHLLVRDGLDATIAADPGLSRIGAAGEFTLYRIVDCERRADCD